MVQPPYRLKGMTDHDSDAVSLRRAVAGHLCGLLSRYGYRQVETPILEPTELLLRKSGGEFASKMYSFSDPGGHRVSLRPEFTSSVVRAFLQQLGNGPLPVRYSYEGPVLRYEPERGAQHRQFTQVGAEIIGAQGPLADAEVMAVACKGLTDLGHTGWDLVIGHLGFIGALLESLGLSDRTRLFLLSNLSVLSQGREGAEQVREKAATLGLWKGSENGDPTRDEAASEAGVALLERYLQTTSPATIGVRTPEEIRERFLKKQTVAQDARTISDAIELLAEVAQVKGPPAEALRRVRGLVTAKQARIELQALEDTVSALTSLYGVGAEVYLDFGLGRGIAYYTGAVFELRHKGLGSASLGGGGRYDGLVQSLGGPEPIPAMGFAWTLEHVIEAMPEDQQEPRARATKTFLVRPVNDSANAVAAREAERLRSRGSTVELEVSGKTREECVAYAQAKRIGRIVNVDGEGEATVTDVPQRK